MTSHIDAQGEEMSCLHIHGQSPRKDSSLLMIKNCQKKKACIKVVKSSSAFSIKLLDVDLLVKN
jgi:hypothetical protein